MTNALPALDDDLRALLAAHEVEATTDGVLDWFEKRREWIRLVGSMSLGTTWWKASIQDAQQSIITLYGETRLMVLARAFAAVVGSEEGENDG